MGHILLFIILLILFQRFIKALQKQQTEQQEESSEEKVKNLFQTLGFPLPQVPQEIPPKPKQERPEIKIVELKQTKKIEPPPKQLEEIKEEVVTFSQDKLEEGIILSAILGPPKAYQICRGGGIGIRAGLKNR